MSLSRLAQRVAFLDRARGLDRLLAQVLDLLAQLLVLALRVEDVGRPAVDVLEGRATRLAAISNGRSTLEPALWNSCRPPFGDSRK